MINTCCAGVKPLVYQGWMTQKSCCYYFEMGHLALRTTTERHLFWASGLCSLKQADEKRRFFAVSQSPRVAEPSVAFTIDRDTHLFLE